MRTVVIESPYKGKTEQNLKYARAALLDCLRRGEAPFASHLLYTQVLDNSIPSERQAGIDAGLVYHGLVDSIVFYADLGFSDGMTSALYLAIARELPIEIRSLPEWNNREPRQLPDFDEL